MELKKFRNKYDLELIPASHASIILGCLVWDPLIGKPRFNHPGMPQHIFNAFLDVELFSEKDWQSYLLEAKESPTVAAQFAEHSLNVNRELAHSLDHPQLDELSHSFSLNKVKKFSFGDLKAKTMSNLLRVRIDSYLEALKQNNWAAYDGKIRNVFMITELYYGSIKIVIGKELQDTFNASLQNLDLEIQSEIELNQSIEYTFGNENVPFAMRIEQVRGFNG